MQYFTNASPVDVLLVLKGKQARFTSHNVVRDTWNALHIEKDVRLIWNGNPNVVAGPLTAIGSNVELIHGLPGGQLKMGDSIILLDPTTGDTYEWYTY